MENQTIINQMFNHLRWKNLITTQQSLADAIGVYKGTISNALSGKKPLSISKLFEINSVFGNIFNPNWIMGASDVMLNNDVVKDPEAQYVPKFSAMVQKSVTVEVNSVESENGTTTIRLTIRLEK